MKKCLKCGSFQDDNANFCTECGSPDFWEAQAQYGEQQINKTKKNGRKKAVGITSGTLAVILMTAIPIAFRHARQDYYQSQVEKEQQSSISALADKYSDISDDIPYTSGKITDGKYINEWAEIQFEVPEKFPLYENYTENDNETTDTGYASLDIENGKMMSLTFYGFTDVIDSFDEDMVLDKRIESFKEEADEEANYTISDKYTYTIADKDYRAVDISNQDNGYSVRYCILVKNKRIIEFVVMSDNTEDIDEFFNSVEAVAEE